MSDWQVGDLAVCVDDSVCKRPAGKPWPIPLGAVRRVVGFGLVDKDGVEGLILGGETAFYQHAGFGFAKTRFRKIRPDEHEACEPEFVTLLRRTKRTVRA